MSAVQLPTAAPHALDRLAAALPRSAHAAGRLSGWQLVADAYRDGEPSREDVDALCRQAVADFGRGLIAGIHEALKRREVTS